MKSFKGYLTEFASYSTSELVFRNAGQGTGSSGLMIPISGPMFKRIWPDTIRATVFHTTDLSGLKKLKGLEGGKKTISAFFSMMSRYMETGVATGGGIVVEMEADVLVSARDDIMSQVDNKGRRWVEMSWFEYQTRERSKFSKVERELNDLIRELVLKHLSPILGKDRARREPEFDLWADMKKHMSGDGKALSLAIKDYFDGVEKVIKKNKEVLGDIFYGYTRSKRMTDNSWDEQIVNNIDIKTVHIWPDNYKEYKEEDEDEIKKQITDIKKWPIKTWNATIDLEIYTRKVVAKEIKK
jgi:hypothetical protein